MALPVVNVDEDVVRTVGRRPRPADPLSVASSRRSDARAWQRVFGGVRVARGVYRFHSHEEADEWMWQTIARPTRR